MQVSELPPRLPPPPSLFLLLFLLVLLVLLLLSCFFSFVCLIFLSFFLSFFLSSWLHSILFVSAPSALPVGRGHDPIVLDDGQALAGRLALLDGNHPGDAKQSRAQAAGKHADVRHGQQRLDRDLPVRVDHLGLAVGRGRGVHDDKAQRVGAAVAQQERAREAGHDRHVGPLDNGRRRVAQQTGHKAQLAHQAQQRAHHHEPVPAQRHAPRHLRQAHHCEKKKNGEGKKKKRKKEEED